MIQDILVGNNKTVKSYFLFIVKFLEALGDYAMSSYNLSYIAEINIFFFFYQEIPNKLKIKCLLNIIQLVFSLIVKC